jgi:transposase InsO family protein
MMLGISFINEKDVRRRVTVATAILVLGLTACASGAWAQKPPNPPNPSTFSDVQLIVNPRLAIERAYRIHWFMSLDDAHQKMEEWRRDYNEVRPHSAIGYKPPVSLINSSSAYSPP